MSKQGLKSLFLMEDIAVMGIWELFSHLKSIRVSNSKHNDWCFTVSLFFFPYFLYRRRKEFSAWSYGTIRQETNLPSKNEEYKSKIGKQVKIIFLKKLLQFMSKK